jgi:hypothetical protein
MSASSTSTSPPSLTSELGPIFVLKGRFIPERLDRRLVAEMWFYPDGERVLELSTRAETNETFQVAAEVRAYLVRRGIDLTGEQQPKTRKALEIFAAKLQSDGGASAGK